METEVRYFLPKHADHWLHIPMQLAMSSPGDPGAVIPFHNSSISPKGVGCSPSFIVAFGLSIVDICGKHQVL